MVDGTRFRRDDKKTKFLNRYNGLELVESHDQLRPAHGTQRKDLTPSDDVYFKTEEIIFALIFRSISRSLLLKKTFQMLSSSSLYIYFPKQH